MTEKQCSSWVTKTKSPCWQLVKTLFKRWKTWILTATASRKYKENLFLLENPHVSRRCSDEDSFYSFFEKYSNELWAMWLWFSNPEGTLFSQLSSAFRRFCLGSTFDQNILNKNTLFEKDESSTQIFGFRRRNHLWFHSTTACFYSYLWCFHFFEKCRLQ